ncbi:MAG: hypothetical protein GYB66_13195 [Chloroflexi bacterium]|nr:hypothetical protein [Chloroflexota bacterium]
MYRRFRHTPLHGGNGDDIARLDQALKRTGAQRLVVLGDLVHGYVGYNPPLIVEVAAWRQSYPKLPIHLIRGNHDRAVGDPPLEWNIQPQDGPMRGPLFVLQHEPVPPPRTGYALAGHLHPTVEQTGSKQRHTLPFFWFRKNMAVLPAFVSLVPHVVITPGPKDTVFAINDETVERT